MASAIARLGAARRGIIKGQRQTDMWSNVFSTAATAVTFASGQAKKADTAWGEYEKGYEALGGDVADITKPKFGEKGWFKSTFKGPGEGEVGIGKKMYDIEKVRKAGAFLGGDAATALFAKDEGGGMQKKYMQRTAPGRDMTSGELRKRSTAFTSGLKFDQTGGIGVGAGFGQGTGGVQGPDFLKDYQTPTIPVGERGRDAAGTVKIQQTQLGELEKSLSEYGEGGKGRSDFLEKQFMKKYRPNVPVPFEDDYSLGDEELIKDPGFSEFGKWDKPVARPLDLPGSLAMRKRLGLSYAKGGSFVTNGPQMIMVGDNPGGREAVNVVPLNSDDRRSNEKRSLLESLYENNRTRRTY